MRISRLLALSFLFFMVPIVAFAGVTIDPGAGKVNAIYNVTIGYASGAARAPGGTYSYSVQAGGTGNAVKASGGEAGGSLGVGWGGMVVFHDNETNETYNYTLGDGLRDGYIIIENTTTYTYTTTITRTVTLPGGETTVVTEVRTVTVPERGPDRRAVLAGLGALAALLFLLARR